MSNTLDKKMGNTEKIEVIKISGILNLYDLDAPCQGCGVFDATCPQITK